MELLNRQCSLIVRASDKVKQGDITRTVDELEIKNLRIQFKIEKTLKPHPNTAVISVTNLAEASRAKFQKYFVYVRLQAGYGEELSQIFTGAARTVDQVRTGAEWVTKVEAGDGEDVTLNTYINESFKPGTSVSDVLKKIISKLAPTGSGLDPGDALKRADDLDGTPFTSFKKGYAVNGKAWRELDKLLTSLGWSWSIQDGRIQILKIEEAAPGRILVLAPDSGLIGSPEHGSPDKKGKPGKLKVKCLLLPGLKCGGNVKVDSEGLKGVFRIERLIHTGDTAGQDWYSEMELAKVKV